MALTYSSNSASAQQLAKELQETSTGADKLRITTHKADLADPDQISNLCAEVQKAHDGKTVDILISNAGYGKRIRDVS